MDLFQWLTLVSFLGLAYIYIGYPLLMMVLARALPYSRRSPGQRDLPQGPVSVVMTVHNEARLVLEKVDNLLALDRGDLELSIVLVDDGSTDGTGDLLEQGIRERPQAEIHLLRLPRSGKSEGVNRAVAYIREHLPSPEVRLVMLCDVRQVLEQDALIRLLEALADPSVGYSYGNISSATDKGPGLYWEYEKRIRGWESDFYASPGGTGQLALTWLSLFTPIPRDSLLDDVYMPMECIYQGRRVVFVDAARGRDVEFDVDREVLRKYRTITGNYQYIAQRPRCLSPLHNRVWFQFWSHKVARLLSPYLLVTLAISSLATSLEGWPAGLVLLAGQVGFYAAAALPEAHRIPRVSSLARTFTAVNAASVVGLIRFIQGDYRWSTAKDKEDKAKA